MEQKELKIRKEVIRNVFNDLIISFLILVPISFILQHFGEVGETVRDFKTYYTYNSFSNVELGFTDLWQTSFDNKTSNLEKVRFIYLPLTFDDAYFWFAILPVFILIRLKRKFSKHYKIVID